MQLQTDILHFSNDAAGIKVEVQGRALKEIQPLKHVKMIQQFVNCFSLSFTQTPIQKIFKFKTEKIDQRDASVSEIWNADHWLVKNWAFEFVNWNLVLHLFVGWDAFQNKLPSQSACCQQSLHFEMTVFGLMRRRRQVYLTLNKQKKKQP